MIKCTCGRDDCQIGIHFDGFSRAMFLHDRAGIEHLMYLDANTIVELIKELRTILNQIVELAGKDEP